MQVGEQGLLPYKIPAAAEKAWSKFEASLQSMLCKCWSRNPEERPEAGELSKFFNGLKGFYGDEQLWQEE